MITFNRFTQTPDPSGQYVAAILIAALYDDNRAVVDQMATWLGGERTAYEVNKLTIPPDYCVLTGPGWRLVAFSGTTNKAQVVNYVNGYPASVDARLIPSARSTPLQVNSGFQDGLDKVYFPIVIALGNLLNTTVYVTGHSYGGATALILARRLAGTPAAPAVQLLTFGEPKSFSGTSLPAVEVGYHARLIGRQKQYGILGVQETAGEYDPVTLLPPSGGFCSLLSPATYWAAQAFGDVWAQSGLPYLLSADQVVQGAPPSFYTRLAVTLDILDFAYNAHSLWLHYLESSYLPWSQAAWQRQPGGHDPTLSQFAGFVSDFLGEPPDVPTALGPSVSNADINASSFAAPAQPVNDSNRNITTLVLVDAYTVPDPVYHVGELPMSFYKGTVDFNSVQGGWSESVYSIQPGDTAASMTQKMIGWLNYRMKMSYGPDYTTCTNPILPYWVRVEDELLLRDSAVTTVLPPGSSAQGNQIVTPPSYPASGPVGGILSNQNIDLELGTRLKVQSGANLQYAYPMFHGIPLGAVAGTGAGANFSGTFLRDASFTGLYQTQVWNLLAYMAQVGLGYRNITGAWNAANNAIGPYCKPALWAYDTVGEQVILWWTTPTTAPPLQVWWPGFPSGTVNQAASNWPNVNAKCRLQVRQWKQFPVLQGRWAASVEPLPSPNTGGYTFGLRILRQVRLPQCGATQVPAVSPIAWTPWFPSQQAPSIGAGNSSGPNPTLTVTPAQIQLYNSIQYVESKKLGRTFGLERGRQRNRAT